jgi:hypothetical protein
MESIRIARAFDGGLSYNRSFNYKDNEFKKNISISVQNEMTTIDNLDVVIMESIVAYAYKEEQLFRFGVVVFFDVDGWNHQIKTLDQTEIKKLPVVEKLIGITIGYLRGSLSALSKNTPVEGLILPILSTSEMAGKLIIKFDKGKKEENVK